MDLDPDACYRAIKTRDVRFDGRLFTGVLTTGIYCRPVCPAKVPKRENVRFFRSAAAAHEAGFRACLRCRPETSPELGVWRGVENTVSRALQLIENGALDRGDVEALAERLGVGGRQLRRLFEQHLGASPVRVAQTRRVHLAKQLLTETTLPMAQVAEAAGFGSVRRFNETFATLYGRPPAALRKRAHTRADTADAVTVRLRYRPPYDWEGLLQFLATRAIAGVELVTPDCYARTIALGSAYGTVSVTREAGDQLAVRVCFPQLRALPAILARVRRLFDLAADPEQIGRDLSQDPLLAQLVQRRPGLRVPGAWDGFELAIRGILGQQISVKAAVKLASRLCAEHGAALPEPWASAGLTHAFPSAERLKDQDFRTLGMPSARARALAAISAAACADPELFGPRKSLEHAIEALRALPGVGTWTAQYIAMRQLREPDAFPTGDAGLVRALAAIDGMRSAPAQLEARAERWRPWRAYAALHLWSSLDNHKDHSDAKHSA